MAVRTRGARAVLGLLAGVLLLTGCASMPGSGPVQRVDSSQRADSDSQVRVFGVSPQDGMSQLEIVQGFLEATTSDEADFSTAKEYLTPGRRQSWDAFHGTTVLSTGPELDLSVQPGQDGSGRSFAVNLSGERVATVDSTHAYTPRSGSYQATFQLRKVKGEWRIDTLPDGLILGEKDFQRNYRSVNTYYYADFGSEAGQVAQAEDVLVADPVYVRRRVNTVRETVRSLLDGPGSWIDSVVTTAAPEGVRLARGTSPSIDESGVLTTRLDGVPDGWSGSGCQRMAAQLFHTVQEVSSVEVTEVRLLNQAGTSLCEVSSAQAERYAPGLLDGDFTHAYALTEDHRLATVGQGDDPLRTVSGALGRGDVELRDAAVSRDEQWAAGISADGSSLYVTPVSGSDSLPEASYSTTDSGDLTGEDDPGLTRPSWDGLGDLWFADGSTLLRMADGRGDAQEVPVAGLGEGQHIEAVRVASDGVRIMMLISEDGHSTLQLGRIERTGTGEATRIEVAGLRPVAPQLEQVSAASWAGGSSLVVVGRPADGVEQLQYVTTDGSSASTPTGLPGLNDVTQVAAAEDENLPLLAETADGIARLEDDDTQWKLVRGNGSDPFYPG